MEKRIEEDLCKDESYLSWGHAKCHRKWCALAERLRIVEQNKGSSENSLKQSIAMGLKQITICARL